ncbi:MAG: cell wall hydrolase [Lachnospiraceae bacterium]|nr:cell wall hydrolase [Lachnospiraceae bacterium]
MRLSAQKRGELLRRLLVLLLVFFTCLLPVSATEDTKEKMDAAQRKKEEKQTELESAQKDLENTEENLAALRSTRNGYQGEMMVLNEEMQLVADQLAVLETKMELKQIEIDETRENLQAAVERRQQQYESMKTRIRFLYESGGNEYMELLFSARDFAEFLNFADYVEQLSAYDRRMLKEYVEGEAQIREEERLLQEEMDEMLALQENVVEQQERVGGLIDNTAERIRKTTESIEDVEELADAFEEEVAKKQEEVDEAEEEYQAIKAKYEEELRLSKLAAQSEWRDISQIQFEEGDRYLLANLIYCEAGNQPYEGQVAVGAVVMNRVLSSVFPNTVTGVIYQRNQFSPTLNGMLANALAVNKATEACYRAADDAMAGSNPVGSRVFFRTPIPGLEGLRIGDHIFY